MNIKKGSLLMQKGAPDQLETDQCLQQPFTAVGHFLLQSFTHASLHA